MYHNYQNLVMFFWRAKKHWSSKFSYKLKPHCHLPITLTLNSFVFQVLFEYFRLRRHLFRLFSEKSTKNMLMASELRYFCKADTTLTRTRSRDRRKTWYLISYRVCIYIYTHSQFKYWISLCIIKELTLTATKSIVMARVWKSILWQLIIRVDGKLRLWELSAELWQLSVRPYHTNKSHF